MKSPAKSDSKIRAMLFSRQQGKGYITETMSIEDRLKPGYALEKVKTYKRPSLLGDTNIKIGRNWPCPCGSEKKFKKCCAR